MTYKTTEIAKLVGIHPNTVRIYEQWGFISPVPRLKNGYRDYSDTHLFQLKIARILFRCEIVQGNIRNLARTIVLTCGQEQFQEAEQLTKAYLIHLQKEYNHAEKAIQVVHDWLDGKTFISSNTYTRKEMAALLDVTPEMIRNWERNGLITVPRLPNGHRVYTDREYRILRVIRSLRGAHYSISAILRLLSQIHHVDEPDIQAILNTPSENEDIITETDRLGKSLQEAMQDVQAAMALFKKRDSFQLK